MNEKLEQRLVGLYGGLTGARLSSRSREDLQRAIEFGGTEEPRLSAKAALVLVDVQRGFDDPIWGKRSTPEAEAVTMRLLKDWRASGRPVIHIRHMSRDPQSPLRPEQSGNEIKEEARPLENEPVIEKCVNSSFIGTDLERLLKERGIETLVLLGFTANHCVSTTARMAGNLGFNTYVVSDATVAFERRGPDGKVYPAELMHDVGLAELHGEFATVVDSKALIAMLK